MSDMTHTPEVDLSKNVLSAHDALPPTTDDDHSVNFFASDVPNTKRASRGHSTREEPPPKEGGAFLFLLTLLSTLLVGSLLVVFLYLTFITLGAAVDLIIQGPLRLVLTVIASLIIPIVPLISEGEAHKHAKIAYRTIRRIRSAMAIGFFGSLMSFFLLSFALPEHIVFELRSNPNWFLGAQPTSKESTYARHNRVASYKIADLIEQSTSSVGMYSRTTSLQKNQPKVAPKPTHPKSIPKSTQQKKGSMPAPTRPRRTFPKPTRPSTKQSAKVKATRRSNTSGEAPLSKNKTDKDYVEWK